VSAGSNWTIISLADNGEIIDWEYNFGGDFYAFNTGFMVPNATVV
jgi:hypothetical protein